MGVDGPTIALCAVMWLGLAANLAWASMDPDLPVWRHVIHIGLGVLFLNLSFTVWHEAAHGTVFRSSIGNRVVGVLGAWPAWIPYFLIRRAHFLHHIHANDPERDPDAWFNAGSIWTLPLRYPAGIRRTKAMVDAAGRPRWERVADGAQAVSLLVAFAAIAALLGPRVLITCWIIPKAISMWIHALYVNVLPHRDLPSGRFLDTRTYAAPFLAPLTLMHSLHGVHHAWPNVPWHRYGRLFAERRRFLEARGAPIVDRMRP